MINRINSDLANGLGNLVSRTVAMVEKYFGGTLPSERQAGEFDEDLINEATSLRAKVDDFIEKTQLQNALADRDLGLCIVDGILAADENLVVRGVGDAGDGRAKLDGHRLSI